MAGGGPIGSSATQLEIDQNRNYTAPMVIMTALFFMIGFITVFNDVLIPSLKLVFDLKPWQATLIQFCFFGAYGIMAYPSGEIIKRVGYKKGLMIGLATMGIGLLLFVPASMVVSYAFFLFALFVVASGLTILQVAINPYMSVLGPPETAAARLTIGGSFNSLATFLGPIIGGATVLAGIDDMTTIERAEHVQGPYIMIAVITILIAVILYFIQLPKLNTDSGSKVKLQGSAFDFRNLNLGAFAIFFYVGAEVAIGTILVIYLKDSAAMGNIKEELGSSYLAYYWMGAMIGRFAGIFLLRLVSAQKALTFVTAAATILVVLSMTSPFMNMWIDVPVIQLKSFSFESIHVPMASLLLVIVGLFNSIMWPSIFPLGIRGLGKHTSQASGIMVTMVIGGAFIPLIQGGLVEIMDYRYSFIIVVLCYLYLFYYGVSGHKSKKADANILAEKAGKSQEAAV